MFYGMPVFYTIEQVAHAGYYLPYMLNPIATLLVSYQRALLPPPMVSAMASAFLKAAGPWR